MNSASRGRRDGTRIAVAGVIVLGAVVAAGAVIRPRPMLSKMYTRRASPTEHVVGLGFDHPGARDLAGPYFRDPPLNIRVITLLPVALQVLNVSLRTITTARLLVSISGGAALTARARRNLTALSVAGVVGGLVQFGLSNDQNLWMDLGEVT